MVKYTLKTKSYTESSSNKIDIPFEKWELNNGLKVLIHEDNSDPLVQVHVTYHVGSNRETAGKSGFAHLFEHMLFQGSEHVEDEEAPRIIAEAGGRLNGNISFDRTVYFQTVPSNHLETILWLESDRMVFLLNAATKEKFENQRKVVKNEVIISANYSIYFIGKNKTHENSFSSSADYIVNKSFANSLRTERKLEKNLTKNISNFILKDINAIINDF